MSETNDPAIEEENAAGGYGSPQPEDEVAGDSVSSSDADVSGSTDGDTGNASLTTDATGTADPTSGRSTADGAGPDGAADAWTDSTADVSAEDGVSGSSVEGADGVIDDETTADDDASGSPRASDSAD
ncbi:hypothetical protein V6N00_16635 [Tersicoccus sp. MR15.9]|uniref:hypothetical protein n=1 Tax=Tersicoccus mangrovi TaxID=3121635 RepID=UPI002FE60E1A